MQARVPIIPSIEHDTLSICGGAVLDSLTITTPSAPTAVVDAAIELFALLLPAQDLVTVERFVNQVIEFARAARLERNVGRKAAVSINVSTALFVALNNGALNTKHARDTFGSAQVGQTLSAFLKVLSLDTSNVSQA